MTSGEQFPLGGEGREQDRLFRLVLVLFVILFPDQISRTKELRYTKSVQSRLWVSGLFPEYLKIL